MVQLFARFLAVASGVVPLGLCATTITFDPRDLVATIHTQGQYDNVGLGTWNGQPVSEDNRPTADQNQLTADWNLYVPSGNKNQLFIEVLNVQDTRWGTIFGSVFEKVTLTGFDFSLPVRGNPNLLSATFSSEWARPGQVLDGRASSSDPVQQVPLINTPGWALSSLESTTSSKVDGSISVNNIGYGLSHFTNIYGTTRIVGGGVFQLVFDPGIDLISAVDFRRMSFQAVHGFGAYVGNGSVDFAIRPDPVPDNCAANVIMGMLFVGLVLVRLRCEMSS